MQTSVLAKNSDDIKMVVASNQRPNFTGTWQCISCEGFEEYLEALRVSPEIKRSLLISGSRPTHVIAHQKDKLEWCVDAPQGRVASVQRIGQRSVTKNAHGEVMEVARWEGAVWVVDVMQVFNGTCMI